MKRQDSVRSGLSPSETKDSSSSSLQRKQDDDDDHDSKSEPREKNDICGVERLKKHREEVGGKVVIPETWGQEDFLKDWIDSSSFDKALAPDGIASARQALIAASASHPPQQLRITSK